MPNIYKRKHPERVLNEEGLQQALLDIKNKIETPTSAARKYNVNRTTIIYRLKLLSENRVANELQGKASTKYSVGQVLSRLEEGELTEYFKNCSNLHHGLTFDMAKLFVYEYVKKNNIKYPSSWDKDRAAGKVWLSGFMRRNPTISLRKPENISLARLRAFTKPVVLDFFGKLESLFLKHSFKPEDIYNLDETGITTVMDSVKVIAEKGKRTVSQTASGERGTLVTMVAIVNAAGNHVPPVYVCPRKRATPLFMKGAMTGSIGLFADSGWMNAVIFLDVLKHLKKFTKCSKENRILLLLDNHASHCSLEAILYCHDNGIVLLSFPPHTSHRLQPLDVGVFGPFKKQLKASFNNYIVNNPQKTQGITIYDIPSLSSTPFLRAFSPENITKGFSSTGIYPFNCNIFDESEFCEVEESEGNRGHNDGPTCSLTENSLTRIPSSPSVITTSADKTIHSTPENIRPLPKLKPKKTQKGRPAGKSRIYTETPEKNRLIDLSLQKAKKQKAEKIKKTKVVKRVLADSYSNESDNYSIRDSDTSLIWHESDDSKSEGLENIKFSDNVEAVCGDYVLIKFGNYKNFYYVGLVIAVARASNLPYTIKYFRRQSNTSIFFEPAVEDIKLALSTDLVAKLPDPLQLPGTSTRKGKIQFEVNFSRLDVR